MQCPLCKKFVAGTLCVSCSVISFGHSNDCDLSNPACRIEHIVQHPDHSHDRNAPTYPANEVQQYGATTSSSVIAAPGIFRYTLPGSG
jgi:hypothetical protein